MLIAYNFYIFENFYSLDQNKKGSQPDLNGTYASAWQNPSIDYFAIFLPRSSIINDRM